MAEERIIFPARPLFIVDRGWQRSRKKAPTNPRSIKDDVQTICVTGATSLRTENPSDFQLASPLMKLKGSRKREHTNDPPLPTIQFLPYDAAQMKETRSSKRTRHFAVENKTSATVSDPSLAAPPVLPSNRTPASAIPLISENPISGSATPLYTVIDPEATAFQHFVGYYPTRIASGAFPISKYVPLQSNPIAQFWYPAAITDDLLLHTILFSTALKVHFDLEHRSFPGSETLLKVILDRLNRRIRSGRYSDETIGAVSCMALCENVLGNHNKWSMHTTGMSEMIRVRGGLSSIRGPLQMKIYRASIMGAVDTLSQPCLPRLTRTTQPLYHVVGMGMPDLILRDSLDRTAFGPQLIGVLLDLSFLTQALNYTVENQVTLDHRAYEEDIFCIAYDLLSLPPLNGIARSCQLAALVFVQMVLTDRPLVKESSTLISQELRESLRDVSAEGVPTALFFWVHFLGGLISFQSNDRRWYRNRLSRLVRHSNMVNWKAAKSILQQIMWIECLQDPYGQKLWNEINQ